MRRRVDAWKSETRTLSGGGISGQIIKYKVENGHEYELITITTDGINERRSERTFHTLGGAKDAYKINFKGFKITWNKAQKETAYHVGDR